MNIPGIDSIILHSASEVWPGEPAPAEHLVGLFDGIPAKLKLGRFDEVSADLIEIARDNLHPSQTVRLLCLQADLLTESEECGQAYELYYQAMQIADEQRDTPTEVLLMLYCGLMLYGQTRQYEAIILYEEALALWRAWVRLNPAPSDDTVVAIHGLIAETQWSSGQFDAAIGTVARALTAAKRQDDTPVAPALRDATASALWTLGLALRSQSDMSDGDFSLLESALDRMEEGLALYKKEGSYADNIGRLLIQMAEVRLDQAELHLQHDRHGKARMAREHAERDAKMARDFLQQTINQPGQLLPELTLLRCEITRSPDPDALLHMTEFESRLCDIEREAEEIHDGAILAKAAMLRGQWLLWLDDPEPARKALLIALKDLQPNNMGLATRAQRLLRRANEVRAERHVRRATGPRVSRPRRRS